MACRSLTCTRFSTAPEADFIGRAVRDAPLDAAAGEPERKGVRVVIAPRLLAGLGDRQSAEFATPDDQRVVEQSPCSRSVRARQSACRSPARTGRGCPRCRVAVPTPLVLHPARIDLHKAHAPFDESPGKEALSGEMRAPLLVEPVELLDVLGSLAVSSAAGAAVCMR